MRRASACAAASLTDSALRARRADARGQDLSEAPGRVPQATPEPPLPRAPGAPLPPLEVLRHPEQPPRLLLQRPLALADGSEAAPQPGLHRRRLARPLGEGLRLRGVGRGRGARGGGGDGAALEEGPGLLRDGARGLRASLRGAQGKGRQL